MYIIYIPYLMGSRLEPLIVSQPSNSPMKPTWLGIKSLKGSDHFQFYSGLEPRVSLPVQDSYDVETAFYQKAWERSGIGWCKELPPNEHAHALIHAHICIYIYIHIYCLFIYWYMIQVHSIEPLADGTTDQLYKSGMCASYPAQNSIPNTIRILLTFPGCFPAILGD